MRKLLFFILSMMTCLSAFSYEVTVNVSPTTPLSECLSSEQQQTVDSIKVYGKLSEVDFNLLNRMTVSYKLIHIDLFNTTNTSIGSNAFESSPLKSIVLPKNCTSIGYLSFAHCSDLESIELGNMLTSIANGALRQCYNLKQITFPSTLRSIGTQAMDYTPFQHIYCLGETPASASANAWTCYSTCTVHVPLNCKSKYENANGWMRFENIVEETNSTIWTVAVPPVDKGVIYINGQLLNNQYYKIEEGKTLVITLRPNEGCVTKCLSVNGVDVTKDMVDDTYTIESVNQNITLSVEFLEIPLLLTIKSAENGHIAQEVEKGKNYSCVITPHDGWKLESVSFNGNNVTSNLNDNKYTTPEILSDSELNIVYKKDVSNAVQKISSDSEIKVSAAYGKVYIQNNGTIQQVSIYNVSGAIVDTESVGHGITTIDLPTDKLYIIKIGNETYKVAL